MLVADSMAMGFGKRYPPRGHSTKISGFVRVAQVPSGGNSLEVAFLMSIEDSTVLQWRELEKNGWMLDG